MSTKHPEKLTPRLRFPEFKETPAWPRTRLGKVLTEHKLKSDGKAEVHSVSLTKGIVPQVEHMGRSFSAADTSHYSLVQPNDVVYTKSPLAIHKLGIVKQHRHKTNAIVSPLYGVFEPDNPHLGRMVEAYFDSPYRSIAYLAPLAQKGAKNTIQITNTTFLSGSLYLPADPAEQEKIAACLRSLDDWIAAEARALAALRRHKTGLMQQLFPRPGETLPRLRFPEFRDGGAWDTARLGTICNFVRGPFGGALKKEIFVRDGYAVYEQSHAIHGDLEEFRYFITADKFQELERFSVKAGDIIMSCSGTMGRFTLLPSDAKPGVINQALLKLTVNTPFSTAFVLRALELPSNLSKLLTQSAGGAMKNVVGVKELKAIEISVPKPAEQHRIADCLAALDASLSAQTEKLAALRHHKCGLMQRLFPLPGSERRPLTN